MLGAFPYPNYFLMLCIGFASALALSLPLFNQSIRERIWHWSIGESSLRFGLAFLAVALSFMSGAAYLSSLFPPISSCTTSYSSSYSVTTTTTTTVESATGIVELGTPEPIFEGGTTTTSSDCFDSNQASTSLEIWFKMLFPPLARSAFCFSSAEVCSSLHDVFFYSGSYFPANSLEAYLALWGISLASGLLSLYMTAYLLRDARKRKVED
jgi:hypothetical protein